MSSLRKFKKIYFQIPIKPKSVPKVSKRVLNMFWEKFCEKFYAQCSMEGRVFENLLKNQKFLKIQKCPKSFPKVSKHVLNMFWGKLFENFLSSFPWNVESSKIYKNIFSKFQKCPKVFPKVSKRVLNLFCVNFFEIFFLPSVPWRVEFSKIFKKKYFQNSKNAQKCSQLYPNVF